MGAIALTPLSLSVDASNDKIWQSYAGGVVTESCPCNKDSCRGWARRASGAWRRTATPSHQAHRPAPFLSPQSTTASRPRATAATARTTTTRSRTWVIAKALLMQCTRTCRLTNAIISCATRAPAPSLSNTFSHGERTGASRATSSSAVARLTALAASAVCSSTMRTLRSEAYTVRLERLEWGARVVWCNEKCSTTILPMCATPRQPNPRKAFSEGPR